MTIEHLSGKLAIQTAFESDKGRKQENQDCLGIKIPQDATLNAKGVAMVIADGVSAAECAAQASHLVVKGFSFQHPIHGVYNVQRSLWCTHLIVGCGVWNSLILQGEDISLRFQL